MISDEYEPLLPEVYRLLLRLELSPCQVGFFYTAHAVALAVREPERLRLVTKCLYPAVAKRFGVTSQAVERGIRASIQAAWTAESGAVQALSPAPLTRKPRAARFIALLAAQFAPSKDKTGPAS